MEITPGKILLLGSGETSHAGGQAFETVSAPIEKGFQIRLLETPAGFELNSPQVVGRVADYMRIRLNNYSPDIQLVAARRKTGEYSTDSAALAEKLAEGDLIFMGPGSPTYTIKQLKGSRIWETLKAAFLQGANLAIASAATIVVGKFALPVYEIYKVGQDPFWNRGLNLLSIFGLNVSFIPHWNNNDGGAELDTSRCFIGRPRFDPLMKQMPKDHLVIGLDEQTGLILDIPNRVCKVIGKGQVHLLRNGDIQIFSDRDIFPMGKLGKVHIPEKTVIGLETWETVARIRSERKLQLGPAPVPVEVDALVELRQKAREAKNWPESDRIRDQIASLGWKVIDTPEGQKVEQID